jgi:TonB family protein
MKARRFFSKVAASATIFSLAVTPDMAAACTFLAPIEIESNHMRQKCNRALADPKRFLAKVKAGKFDQFELGGYVRAFDEGKYGCRKNTRFVFRMLDSFYSVRERKFSTPTLLRRYAFSWPEKHKPVERQYVYNLLWLFDENGAYLPIWWTPEQARAFVEEPQHWNIALSKFGNSRNRDDAVFASLSDPKSSHFDREKAAQLSQLQSKHRSQREVVAASLFIDPLAGPVDFAKAETLLPASALYADAASPPEQQKARTIWEQIAEGYEQSGDTAMREKATQIRTKLVPPALSNWPTMKSAKDGPVWLSIPDWPQPANNPFASAKIANVVTAHDYPSRSLRNQESGPVAVAARFGPDGKFSGLEIIQSSGSDLLNEATIKNIQRRFRPKLEQIALDGYQGKEVLVPFLIVNWRLGDVPTENGGVSSYADGILSITASPRSYDVADGGCSLPASIFL